MSIYSFSEINNIPNKTFQVNVNQYSFQNPPTIIELENNAIGASLFEMASSGLIISDILKYQTNGVDGTYYLDWGIAIPVGYYQIVFQKYYYEESDGVHGSRCDISCVLIQQDTPLPSPVSPLDITNKKAYLQTFPVQWADDDDYKQCVLDFLNIISSCLVNQNVWLQAIAQKSENVNLDELIDVLSTIGEILHDKELTQPILINQNNTENFASLENEDWNLNNDDY